VFTAWYELGLLKKSSLRFVFKGLVFFILHEGKDGKEKGYSVVNRVYFEMILGCKVLH
jgi:hypothetical protein